MPDASAVGTAADVEEASHPAVPWVRRAVLAAMALVVAAALTGLLGVHTSQASARRDGYLLTLRLSRAWPGRASTRPGRSR